jgi:hypothetical protein
MCIAIWTLWRVTSKRPLTWSNIQKMMQTRPSKHCSLWMRTCPWRCTIRIEMTSQTCQTPLGRYSRVRARPARVRLRLQTQGHREAQRANRNSFLIKLIDHTQLKSTGNQRYESFSFSKKKEKKILSKITSCLAIHKGSSWVVRFWMQNPHCVPVSFLETLRGANLLVSFTSLFTYTLCIALWSD